MGVVILHGFGQPFFDCGETVPHLRGKPLQDDAAALGDPARPACFRISSPSLVSWPSNLRVGNCRDQRLQQRLAPDERQTCDVASVEISSESPLESSAR